MPEIDTDTFQVVALALSGLAVIVSLIVLSLVTRLRRDVADLESSVAAPATARSAADPRPTPEVQTSDPEPRFRATPEPEPAIVNEPVATATGGAQADLGTPSPAATTSMPEEEPFERDGRWWYKRGDELLVYDEGSGQWEPAPAGAFGAGATAAGSASAETAYTSVSEAAPPPAHEEGFWKCPSCGAVNGATAASCRMCFTARP